MANSTRKQSIHTDSIIDRFLAEGQTNQISPTITGYTSRGAWQDFKTLSDPAIRKRSTKSNNPTRTKPRAVKRNKGKD